MDLDLLQIEVTEMPLFFMKKERSWLLISERSTAGILRAIYASYLHVFWVNFVYQIFLLRFLKFPLNINESILDY